MVAVTSKTPEELAAALELAGKIEMKAVELLRPLEIEMRLMKWRPEFRAIMWEAIGRKALSRAKEAAKG